MTEKEVKRYEDLTVGERYERINSLGMQIEDVIKGKINSEDVESFFIALHTLGGEVKRFMQHYFNDTKPSNIIGNCDILNKVNKINLMITVR